MKLVIVGAGYVGLVSGAGFAGLGHDVTCVEKLSDRVKSINSGRTPFFEQGLGELLKQVLKKKKFRATADYSAVRDADLVLVCVGTPSAADGSVDLSFVKEASESIGRELRNAKKFVSIVVKSTVIPGTTKSLLPVLERVSGKKFAKDFGVGMAPEFLREGSALADFNNPDRIVIGFMDGETKRKLGQLHEGFKCPKFETDPTTAELIKYASNAFLATKVSFANELARECELFRVSVDEVAKGMGLDKRIGSAFLNAGIGFGGSCFPKDVKALAAASKASGFEPVILKTVLELNEKQPLRMVEFAEKLLHETVRAKLSGRTVAVLGLAFKPGTDDVRDSPSIVLVKRLLERKAVVRVTDPAALANAKKLFEGEKKKPVFCSSFEEALKGVEVVFIATNWPEYKQPLALFTKLMNAKPPILVDAWRNYSIGQARQAGVAYASIGGSYWNMKK